MEDKMKNINVPTKRTRKTRKVCTLFKEIPVKFSLSFQNNVGVLSIEVFTSSYLTLFQVKVSFELITLRFYHGDHGGGVYEFLDVDVDRVSYFELRDCLKEVGYEPRQYVILECFVCHFAAEQILVPPSLEYGDSVVGPRNTPLQVRNRRKKGPNVGYDESTGDNRNSLEANFETDPDICCTKYVVAEHVAIEMHINEPTRVRVRCTIGCPWVYLLPIHKCDPTNRNKLCNSKFLSMCRRAKNKILDYKDELLRTNPGSTCVVKLHEKTYENDRKMFQCFYICFDGMKKSFLVGCRKCIGLDGCFLKRISKHKLLVVVCKDGNNQMLPLAWAVVEDKNKFTGAWFVKLIKEDLQLGDGTYITVISDISILDHLPNVEHKMCARHILADWPQRWRGIERNKCFRGVIDHLLYINPKRWNNNMAEYFKSWILEARHKTIITMREFCNTMICDISPMAMKVLQENTVKSMKCNKHVVEIQRQTCSCRAWMLKGIPCPNVIAALHHRKLDPINYISHWYNKETYMKTYNYFIYSVISPRVRNMEGNPTKKRKKDQSETSKTGKLSKRGTQMSCSTCHNKAHNKRKRPLGAPASGLSAPASDLRPSTGPNVAPSASPSSRHLTGPAAGPCSKPHSSPTVSPTLTKTAGPRATPDVEPRVTPNAPTRRGSGTPRSSIEKCFTSRRRMVGMCVVHTQGGANIINICFFLFVYLNIIPGMPSQRFRNVKSSVVVTGDLGHIPTCGVIWKGKQVMISSQLEQMRGENKWRDNVTVLVLF
uniref:SWIM-type domain-containing protein n=1 Tax=Solanum lycopersicum TaxID=4081 RepID=A0A3Q7HN27_SOLLC